MNEESKVIEKIRKLLALATSSNEHEAKLAAQKAHELLVEHNLDVQTIENAPDPGYTNHQISERVYQRVEEKFVGQILEKHFFVRVYTSRRRGDGYPYTTKTYLVGSKANISVAMYVHDFLVNKFRELWLVYKCAHCLGENGRQSYYLGLMSGLSKKLESQKNRIQTERGLVLVLDPKLQKIIDEMNLRDGKTKRINVRDRIASDGAADGGKIHIQRGIGDKHPNGSAVLSIEQKRR